MALIGNRSVLNKSLATFRNGTATAGAFAGQTLSNFNKNGTRRNIFANNVVSKKDARHVGYLAPYTNLLPQVSGGLGSYKNLQAEISESMSIAGGKNAEAALSAGLTVTNAALGLIVSLIASLSASGSITNAPLIAVLEMVANTLSASGTLNAPTLGAIASVLASLSASGTITSASMNNSIGYMESDITPYTELSPENLAAALLNSILANYNDPGTVGEALNNAGAAGNPWDALLTTNNDAGTMGELIQKLLKTSTFIGLK